MWTVSRRMSGELLEVCSLSGDQAILRQTMRHLSLVRLLQKSLSHRAKRETRETVFSLP